MAEDAKPKVTDWARLRRILSYLRHYKLFFVLGLLCTIMFGVTEAAVPWLMYALFEPERLEFLAGPEHVPLLLPVLFIGVFLLRGILGFTRFYWRTWMSQTISRDLRREMIDKLLHLPRAYHDRESSGVLIARIMHFVNQMLGGVIDVLVALCQDSARLCALLATLLFINWQYTLILVAAIPITLAVIVFFAKRIRRYAGHEASEVSLMTSAINDVIQGQALVKAYGGQDRESARLGSHIDRLRGVGLRQGVAIAINIPLSQLLVAVALAIILALLAADLLAGRMSEGEVSAFVFAMILIPLSLRGLANLANFMQVALAGAEKVFALLDAEGEGEGGDHADAVRGDIEFDKVEFRYPGSGSEAALQGLSLRVEAGEKVALVGPSGGGKTTITSLLLGFYRPTAGRLELDGVPLADWSLADLRQQLAVVSQDTYLFDTTVAENVAYPSPRASIDRERLAEALQRAEASELVAALPDKEETMLGERGLRLSGGERQRIALARAFYRDQSLLILDEATSSLDSRTEEGIKKSLAEHTEGKTVLIIAHRFATVEIADRVLVIDRGRVAEQGTHAELMGSSQLYKQLYESQRNAAGKQEVE